MLRFTALLAAAATVSIPDGVTGRTLDRAGASRLEQRQHISIKDEGGVGEAVILIPGLSTSRRVWDAVLPSLRARHHVYTVQVNGFGGDEPRGNLAPGILEGAVSELDGFIVAKRLAAPSIVGHSVGGLLGMMMIRAHAQHVGRLLIVDSLPYIGELYRPGVTVAQVEPQARTMRDTIAATFGKPRDAAATRTLADSMAATAQARPAVADLIGRADPRVSAQAMYEAMTTDLRPSVAAFSVPITVTYPADGDALYHRAYGKAPSVTYVPVEGAGHFVMLDRPAVFEKTINEFLR